jgi:hypothetical protein
MWVAKYAKEFKGVSAKAIWSAWADVNNWPKWDAELEKTILTGEFVAGSHFQLKPKGGPTVSIKIIEANPYRTFIDVTKFPLAKMIDYHEIQETSDGILLKSKISVSGPLSWLWKKIVAQGVAAGVPAQMEALVAYAQKQQRQS